MQQSRMESIGTKKKETQKIVLSGIHLQEIITERKMVNLRFLNNTVPQILGIYNKLFRTPKGIVRVKNSV